MSSVPDLPWLLVVATICACGSSSGGSPDTDGDGGGGVVAGSCEHVDLTGAPVVNITRVMAAAPTMTGGQIVPGDYVLTSVTGYNPAGNMTPWGPEQLVMRISSNAVTNDLQPQGSNEIIDGQSYTVSGNVFSNSFTCGGGGAKPLPETYTATPTSITLSTHDSLNDPPGVGDYSVYVFTKR